MALLIMYLVFVQLRVSNASKLLILQIEISKSVLVTALWLWLLIASIFEYRGLSVIVPVVVLIVPM
jgi:hypothetical protein